MESDSEVKNQVEDQTKLETKIAVSSVLNQAEDQTVSQVVNPTIFWVCTLKLDLEQYLGEKGY